MPSETTPAPAPDEPARGAVVDLAAGLRSWLACHAITSGLPLDTRAVIARDLAEQFPRWLAREAQRPAGVAQLTFGDPPEQPARPTEGEMAGLRSDRDWWERQARLLADQLAGRPSVPTLATPEPARDGGGAEWQDDERLALIRAGLDAVALVPDDARSIDLWAAYGRHWPDDLAWLLDGLDLLRAARATPVAGGSGE